LSDADSIALALGQGGEETLAQLARLELAGYVQRTFAGGWSRTAQAAN
jgi:predicted Rossmann fold nucleotide-binding protein DprA/Smf involved in DNA uptake